MRGGIAASHIYKEHIYNRHLEGGVGWSSMWGVESQRPKGHLCGTGGVPCQVAQTFAVEADHRAITHTCGGMIVGLFTLVGMVQAPVIASAQVAAEHFFWKGAVGALVAQFVATCVLDDQQLCGPLLKGDLLAKHGKVRVRQAFSK